MSGKRPLGRARVKFRFTHIPKKFPPQTQDCLVVEADVCGGGGQAGRQSPPAKGTGQCPGWAGEKRRAERQAGSEEVQSHPSPVAGAVGGGLRVGDVVLAIEESCSHPTPTQRATVFWGGHSKGCPFFRLPSARIYVGQRLLIAPAPASHPHFVQAGGEDEDGVVFLARKQVTIPANSFFTLLSGRPWWEIPAAP